jgi:hypothetical protein
MPIKKTVQVRRMNTEMIRRDALQVLAATYREEKHWIEDEDKALPREELDNRSVSWFVVYASAEPVGVVRVLYDPPLALYREYGLRSIGAKLDIDQFLASHRIAEIGRFAVLPAYRKYMVVVAMLMRAASRETIELGYSHYVTDVFEGEQHSPFFFHTRVMGFQPVATHDTGELKCLNRRITLILDLEAAYRRLRLANNWIYRLLTEDWPPELHHRLCPSLEPRQVPSDLAAPSTVHSDAPLTENNSRSVEFAEAASTVEF